MDQDFNLNVKIDTGDAVQGLTNIKTAADQAATSVEKIGESAQSAASEVSKVGDAADKSIPKVQGLGSAFEGAFSTAVQMGSQAGGTLGDIFKSVNQAIPTVKKINSTAITGLKGVKAALISTGIGAFIVAVGVLTSHWEGFLHAVGSSKEEFDSFKSKALDTLGNIVSGIVGVGNVIVQALITPLRNVIVTVQGLGRVMEDVFSGQWGKIKEDAQSALGAIKDVWEKGFDFSGNFQKGKEAGEKFVQGVVTTFTYKAPEVEKTGTDTLSGGSSGKGNSYRKAGEKAGKEFGKGLEESLVSEYRKISSEADKLNENLEEEYRLTEEIANVRKHFEGSNASSFLKDADYEKLAKSEVALEGYIKLIDKAIEEANKLEGEDRTRELEKWETLRTRVVEKGTKEQFSILEEAASKANDVQYKAFNDWISLIQGSIGLKGTQSFEGYGETVEVSARGARQANELWYQLEDERLVANKKFLEDLLAQTQEGTDRYEELQNKIALLDQERTLNATKARDQRIKDIHEEVRTYAEAAQNIADIFGTIAQAEEERIQREVESGKISEEEAKKQFENNKKWQYAQTWINTLAGMTAALTSPVMQSMGIPGWIAAAAQAASLLASGIAQTIKIKNTHFGDTGGSGGGGVSAPNVGVTPIDVRDDIQQSPSVLADSQSPRDQRVYILEGDIQDSNKRVEIREDNSTF